MMRDQDNKSISIILLEIAAETTGKKYKENEGGGRGGSVTTLNYSYFILTNGSSMALILLLKSAYTTQVCIHNSAYLAPHPSGAYGRVYTTPNNAW